MKYPAPAIAFLLIAVVVSAGCIELEWILGMGEEAACGGTAAKVADIDPDHCYQDAAIRKGDTELCNKIESAPPRTKCIMLIAEKNGDKSICAQMENHPGSGEYSRIECLQRVAVKTGDSSICDEIGTDSVSYMFSGMISKETCYEKTGTGTAKSLNTMYQQNKDNFVFCQDIAYAQIYGKPSTSTSGSQKSDVGSHLTNQNEYTVVASGRVEPGSAPSVDLKSGDIIVFGFDAAPDPRNAPHYAVAQGDKVAQILSWRNPSTGQQAGAYDTKDFSWFFSQRTVTNPYTKEAQTSPQIYKYYIVYRKK
ncbi:MAG: hypothetical protein OS112_09745 [Methanoregula sp.]|nr:MAG: hypothetical protein OS112_09745 [Methanoregula sp.]